MTMFEAGLALAKHAQFGALDHLGPPSTAGAPVPSLSNGRAKCDNRVRPASCVGISKAVLLLTDGRIGPALDSQVRTWLGISKPKTAAAWIGVLEGVSEDIAEFEARNGPLRDAVPARFAHLAYGRLYDMAFGPGASATG